MPRRRDFTAEDVPLVGGAVALDFVNTAGARASRRPRERLHTYRDLLVWLERVGVLDASEASAFSRLAAEQPRAASAALASAVSFREDLFGVLTPLATGDALEPEATKRLESWFKRSCRVRRLTATKEGLAWTWHLSPERLESPLWRVVASAEEVVTGGSGLLKRCGECDWLFLDATRNASRQWCKKLCADRVRARRHYERRR